MKPLGDWTLNELKAYCTGLRESALSSGTPQCDACGFKAKYPGYWCPVYATVDERPYAWGYNTGAM